MKKTFLSFFIFITAYSISYAQWTNQSGTSNYYISGNVGIGTTTPNIPLTVVGSGTVANISNFVDQDIQFIITPSGSANKYALITPSTGTNLAFGVGGIEKMRITNAGNIGIGTTSPVNRLDVQGGNASIYNTGAGSLLNVGSGITGKTAISFSTSADAGGYGIIQSVSAQGSAYGNTVINPNGGNVLIGQTSQRNGAYILDVAGSVRANSVVINTTGADFVFEPTYKLKSLSNLKIYIDQNHHLPGIESAKQMQAEGLNVGENQTKLLQKIEELTLYLIDKDRHDKELQATIEEQKQLLANQSKKAAEQDDRIKALETKLEQLLKTNNQ